MDIIDRQDQHRFVGTEEGLEAQLVYRVDGNTLALVHTEVPEALGGRGLGGELVQAAVDRAVTTGETLRPECSYARRWLQKHEDAAAKVTIEWPTGD